MRTMNHQNAFAIGLALRITLDIAFTSSAPVQHAEPYEAPLAAVADLHVTQGWMRLGAGCLVGAHGEPAAQAGLLAQPLSDECRHIQGRG